MVRSADSPSGIQLYIAHRDRTAWLGWAGFEVRNVAAKYPFERSHGFPGIPPNSGHRDYSRLSSGVSAECRCLRGRRSIAEMAGIAEEQSSQPSYKNWSPPGSISVFARELFRRLLSWIQPRPADHFVGRVRRVQQSLGLFGTCQRKQCRVE